MIARGKPTGRPVPGSAYRNERGEVFVYDSDRWVRGAVVFTVFGVAPEQADLDLAPEPSPSSSNEERSLHWKEAAVAEYETWPEAEVTHGVGVMSLRMNTHGDDPFSYYLEIAGLDLKLVEQRWRHVAQTILPAVLWRELEPVT